MGSPLPSKLRISTAPATSRGLRRPENPNANLDTLASPADDVRHP